MNGNMYQVDVTARGTTRSVFVYASSASQANDTIKAILIDYDNDAGAKMIAKKADNIDVPVSIREIGNNLNKIVEFVNSIGKDVER